MINYTKKTMLFCFKIVVLLFLFVHPLFSQYFVSSGDDGSDLNPGTETEPFATIQYALDTVPEESTIKVKAGDYILTEETGGIELPEKSNITLRGENKTNTIINGSNQCRIFNINLGQSNIVIENFTLKNGFTNGSHGASMYLLDVSITLDNVDKNNNNAFGNVSGGAMYIRRSTVVISNSTFATI